MRSPAHHVAPGRCLAYGDGVTLWALGEIVKAQVGIVEQDSTRDRAKVHDAILDTLGGTGDEGRVEAQLRSTSSASARVELGEDRRNQAFAAWRRFLEGLAEQRPLVLVFEDIHWADETLLDFVDELVDWVTDVPLLVLATARPELLERRPGWGGGKLNATTLALPPLTEEQTGELIEHCSRDPLLRSRVAAGTARASRRQSALRGAVRRAVPRTGLDGRARAAGDPPGHHRRAPRRAPAGREGTLQDAAVVGKVFWASSTGRDPDASTTLCTRSSARDSCAARDARRSRARASSRSHTHSYATSPTGRSRAPTVQRSTATTAEWIEDLGRPEDHAEMLADHGQSALELSRRRR